MRHLTLSSLLLLSHQEKRATKVEFDPKTNVIIGPNDVGKSSLLKSIYYTFGAEPAKISSRWKAASVTSVVRFTYEHSKYSILRQGQLFAIFDSGGHLINKFTSVTQGLGPYLADLFDFGLKLQARNGKALTPPPAYLLLPFYVDQDRSWETSWAGFSNLNQFTSWKKELIEYHAGIRSSEYYRTLSAIERMTARLNEIEKELSLLSTARERLEDSFEPSTFNLNIEDFQKEVDELVAASQRLSRIEDSFKSKRTDLINRKLALEHQRGLVEASLKELVADSAFANDLPEDHVECPICGAIYDNSFIERFALARDQDAFREFLLELNSEILEMDESLSRLNDKIQTNLRARARVETTLASRRGTVRLRDIIESEGKKEVRRIFSTERDKYFGEVRDLEGSRMNLKSALKEMDSKEKREAIQKFFAERMRTSLKNLEVRLIEPDYYRDMLRTIQETGSDLPRALLAYYFSMLHTIARYYSGTYFPIVIDSPNQQGQDQGHLELIFRFIIDNQPPDSQILLGTEDLRGVQYPGKMITLRSKYNLLTQKEFPSAEEEMKPFFDQIILT